MHFVEHRFKLKAWLRESLSDDISPLAVDEFEFRQATRQIRLEVSRIGEASDRRLLVDQFRADVTDADFQRLVGGQYGRAFKRIFRQEPLLYTPGKSLDRESP